MSLLTPSPAPRSFSPWWARLFIGLGVLGFLVAVLAHAAQSAVLNPSYYQAVLKDEDAYERAYAELSRDPALLSSSQDLLGGQEIPFLDQVPALLVQAIPVQLVEQMVDAAIEDLIAYLKKHKDLTLTLDITPFVGGAGSPGLESAIDALDDLPAGELPEIEIEDFQQDIDDILDGLNGEGRHLDPDPRRGPFGLRTGLEVDPPEPAVASGIVPDLRDAKFVHEVEIDGETHYLLGPPPDVVEKVDDALFAVQLVSSNSYWLRPVGIIVFVVSVAGLIALAWRDRQRMSRHVGLVLAIGGLLGFFAWLIALPLLQDYIIGAAFEGGSVPSEAFDDLGRDVLRRSVANLTPYIWLPALIAAGMGIALLVSSRWLIPPPRRPYSW